MMIHGDPEFVLTLHSVIEFIGTFAFALSGIRLAASKHYDWLGGFVCGVAVAIGGGTIRDVMLGVRPFWMLSPIYLICTLFAQLVVIACHRYLKRLDNTWFLFDTLGLALFNIAGIQKSLDCGFSFWVAIIMGLSRVLQAVLSAMCFLMKSRSSSERRFMRWLVSPVVWLIGD